MRGNRIIVGANPQGRFLEGVIGESNRKPGCIVQVKAATALTNGRPTFVAAASGTDGKDVLLAVLLEDAEQGFTTSTAFVSGTRCRAYVPIAGEEMNILAGEVAGTGNSFAIGDRLIVDAEDGILVPESGSPQETVAVAMEALTQVTGSTLLFVTIIK